MGRVIAAILLVTGLFLNTIPVQASEASKLFTTNCAACHAGGSNRVVAAKSLKLADLEKYGMSQEAIVTQITKGKNAMPAFGKKLTPEQIQAVAAYVLEQAAGNWGKT